MEYLFDYDIKGLNIDGKLDLTIEEKIVLLHEKKFISELIDIDVENNELHLSSSGVDVEDDSEELDVFVFSFSGDLSLVSKKEILIMLAFEMYKLHNLSNFKDNKDLLIMEEALMSIFKEFYNDFVLLYTLYCEVGKFNPQW